MSLLLDKTTSTAVLTTFHKITKVEVDERTLSGRVLVESYADKAAFYLRDIIEAAWYEMQWLRDSNYIFDGYAHLLSTTFIGATEDLEGESEEMESTVVMPARPSAKHYIDNGNWVVDISLAKQLKLAEIKAARDAEESNGFTAYGKVFDSDSKSLQRISIGVQAAQAVGTEYSIEWTCADYSVITLDQQQMLALPIIMGMAANTMHVKYRGLKDQVALATSIEELSVINW